MAEALRIYRRFYRVSIATDETTVYALVDPYALTTVVRNISQGSAVVESSASTINTTVGVVYADLVASLYNADDTYEIEWQTTYVIGAPVRNLYTRFQIPDIGSGGRVIRELDVELINEPSLSITVQTRSIDYSIEPINP